MKFIVIEGNIGVGKTSLATKLAADLKSKLLLEKFNSNPFLPKFYKNPDKYSFPLELSFLTDRFNQIKNEAAFVKNTKSLVIADYFITKSAIFAEKTLAQDEFQIFQNIYKIILEKIPIPDLYVYLHAKTRKLKKNITKRGRDYEKNISIEYLAAIEHGYLNYINNIQNIPILFIDVNNIDFVNEIDNYDNLKNIIFKSDYKLGVNRLVFR